MTVKFFATYREITKCAQMNIAPPKDVLALLIELCEKFPAFYEKLLTQDRQALGPDAIVLVNGRHIVHLNGVATTLSEQNVVAVFPLVAGG
ncbi:MoaD family protein [Eubacteriales bacterium OttesenSCG-928-K08]|nr:MoaD family protein [Eubacteriales bacterium OttesenSCG-928-K08]